MARPDLPAWLDDVVRPDRELAYRGAPTAAEIAPVFERDEAEARAGIVRLYQELPRVLGSHRGDGPLYRSRTDKVLQRAAARKSWAWSLAEVRDLWAAFESNLARYRYSAGDLLRLPLAAAERVRPQAPEEVAQLVGPLLPRLHRAWCEERVLARVEALCATGDEPFPRALTGGDPVSGALRRTLAGRSDEQGTSELVERLSAYPSGVRPSARWRAAVGGLLDRRPALASLVTELVDVLRTQAEEPIEHTHADEDDYVRVMFSSEPVVPVLRGIAWAAGELAARTPDLAARALLVDAMVDAALNCAVVVRDGEMGELRSMPTATSFVAALGELDGETPVSALLRLRTSLRHRVVLAQVDKALAAVAGRAGLTPAELAERSVPRHGLEPGGRTPVGVGDAVAVVTVDRGVSLSWYDASGRALRSAPASVRTEHADALADLRARVRTAGRVLTSERLRVEGLMATERTWRAADWRAWYAEHPLTGAITRELLWTSGPVTGLPVEDPLAGAGWSLVDVHGRRTGLTHDDVIGLWHPTRASAEEVGAWRDLLAEQQRGQPLKQVYREVYPVTPAEQETATYSNRYAGHVLRYRTLKGLLRTRGWIGGNLGFWDEGYDAVATRVLDERWRARLRIELVESPEHGEVVVLCVSDQVRFEVAVDDGWQPVAVVDVPPLAFSEARRDVDLFVAMTSIASDPTWAERGDDPHLDYWHIASFGDLTASAEVRREALRRLLPRTRIADRVRLDERWLHVRGDLHDYRIHLGSGNVLRSPDDRYLCIVADVRPSRERIHLPFEADDGRLGLIVSKAFLLADDSRIEDPTILAQLRA